MPEVLIAVKQGDCQKENLGRMENGSWKPIDDKHKQRVMSLTSGINLGDSKAVEGLNQRLRQAAKDGYRLIPLAAELASTEDRGSGSTLMQSLDLEDRNAVIRMMGEMEHDDLKFLGVAIMGREFLRPV